MDRRQALKGMLGVTGTMAAAAAGDPMQLLFRPAYAGPVNPGKTVIFVFQRGGCDGLNTVVPFGDSRYYDIRPTIAIREPAGGDPGSAIDLDGFFGLHPGLSPFQQAWTDGNLAVLPTTHYPNESRSHFDSQLFIENGVRDKSAQGYFNKHLQSSTSDALFRAVSMGSSVVDSLRGDFVVPALNRISDFQLESPDFCNSGCSENRLLTALTPIYGQSPAGGQPNHALVHSQGTQLLSDLETLGQIPDTYTPANGASYPNSTYGRQFQVVAQLIKENVGLEIATISIGGWDTHNNQGGGDDPNSGQMRSHVSFAGGIAAFYQDLGTMMDDVIVVTGTEFGRTAYENGNFGTDHGNASSWFVFGNTVNGGIYTNGGWPGLTDDLLRFGRYLEMTVDYKDVMGEVLSQHIGGTDLSSVFPGHTYSPLGLLGGVV